MNNAERETILQFDEESKEWEVYTCHKRIMNKIEKGGVQPHKIDVVDGVEVAKYYTLPKKWVKVSPPPPPRQMTDEQKQASIERLRIMREKAKENKEKILDNNSQI